MDDSCYNWGHSDCLAIEEVPNGTIKGASTKMWWDLRRKRQTHKQVKSSNEISVNGVEQFFFSFEFCMYFILHDSYSLSEWINITKSYF